MIKTKTFEVEFIWFEPGAHVRPVSSHCPLVFGVYTVIKTVEPSHYGDPAIVYVEGYEVGIDAADLIEVRPTEVIFGKFTAE